MSGRLGPGWRADEIAKPADRELIEGDIATLPLG